MELLHTVFRHVCGQPPDRTWHLDSLLLPVCQRCTGLYIGAALAVVFLLSLLLLNVGFLLVWAARGRRPHSETPRPAVDA